MTHVVTDERLYLKSLMEVPEFIAPYVVESGGTLDLHTQLCLWVTSLDASSQHRQ